MNEPVLTRHDFQPDLPPSSPPSVKISRDVTKTVTIVAIVAASTVLVVVDKLPVIVWAMLASQAMGGIFGGSKPEGTVGEQTLERLLKR